MCVYGTYRRTLFSSAIVCMRVCIFQLVNASPCLLLLVGAKLANHSTAAAVPIWHHLCSSTVYVALKVSIYIYMQQLQYPKSTLLINWVASKFSNVGMSMSYLFFFVRRFLASRSSGLSPFSTSFADAGTGAAASTAHGIWAASTSPVSADPLLLPLCCLLLPAFAITGALSLGSSSASPGCLPEPAPRLRPPRPRPPRPPLPRPPPLA